MILKKVLNSIEVADGDVLLNAGAAVFVDSGINEIQMVVFATDERLTILDSNRLTGSILGLTDQAVLYISRAMNWRAEFDGSPERIEIPEAPVKAIRETVINAFAHRLIESRQAVEVAIFKSYIEIFSPGVFPANIDPNDFISQSIRPPRSEIDGVDWEERKQMIVSVLKNDPSISRGKISKETGLTVRQVERALNLLKYEKRIKREGPAHGGRWIVSKIARSRRD